MDAIEKTPRKPSKMRRFFRSFLGRAVIGLILIAIVCSCVWGQVIVGRLKEERIAQKIAEAGGSAGFGGRMFPFPLSYFWIFRSHRRCVQVNLSRCKVPGGLLDEFKEFHQLEILSLDNSTITDADLEHLHGLDQLQFLSLAKTQVSGSGLENLRRMTNLRRLDLTDTAVSDAGLRYLKGASVSNLDLTRTAVTEAGLEHLKELPNLTGLHFDDMDISDVGIEHLKGIANLKHLMFNRTPRNKAELQKALPNCTIRP